jgi:regulator of nonsense transcripts 2
LDKSGNTRSKQRSRKLQLGDIDWYGRRPTTAPVPPNQPASQISLDSYVVDKSRGRGRGNRHGSQIESGRTASGGLQPGKVDNNEE